MKSSSICSPQFAVAAALAYCLAACAVPEPPTPAPDVPVARAEEPKATPPAPPSPAAPAPFTDAVGRAAEQLLQDAQAAAGPGPRELVIDPLIDAGTGQQTTATVQMAQQVATLVKTRVPAWNVRALSRASLATRPLLLIGTLTPINTRSLKDENADAFRICLVLIDLRTGKLSAKRVDRATASTVAAEPIAFFRDSPTWALDAGARAYIKSCQGSFPGDSIDPGYLLRLPAAAIVNEAITAYSDNKPAEAYRLYHDVLPIADPADLRVLNGLYLTSWRTGRKKEAADAFGKLVAVGIETRRLPIKLFFNPGATTLLASADLQAQYAVWLREIALQVAAHDACMKIVGHTSRTGDAAANELLSQKRAALVKQTLERQNRKLAPKLTSDGVGAREIITGLGTDDTRDALDRRVEFQAVDCS